MPVTITCTCYPEDSIAGWEIENTATASADNATNVRDSALTWLNQPTLQVEKTASQDTCNVGDLVAFHVKVTNNAPGTIGRNLVISDLCKRRESNCSETASRFGIPRATTSPTAA